MVCVYVCSLMVMVCMCVLTDGDGVCVYSLMVRDGVEIGCGLHMVFVVAYHIKFTSHVLPNKVVAKLTGVSAIV